VKGLVDKISELRDKRSVTIKGRVLEVSEKRTVNTKYGPTEMSEAVIGDETGRVRVTLWGDKAGSLKEGEVVEIKDAWAKSYRGEVQISVGKRSTITKLSDDEAPPAEEIPETRPRAYRGRGRSSSLSSS
jgi:replication factor A1